MPIRTGLFAVGMKKILSLSILLNLGLGACLVWSWSAGRKNSSLPAPSAVTSLRTIAVERVTPAPASVEPFRWSQLESADYRIYVKNLRGIGCPEAVLRAIVTADVHVIYEQRSRALEQQLEGLADASWSARLGDINAEPRLRMEMQALPDAEAAEVADLLGAKPVPTTPLVTGPIVLHKRLTPEDLPPAMPLVLQDTDLTPLGLNDDQKQTVADLRQNFLAEIGGTNQNPDDPAYLARWQKAQPEADQMLQAMLGGKIYTEYQMLMDN